MSYSYEVALLSYITYSILNIRTLKLLLIKKHQNYMPDASFAGAASISFQHGKFGNKANINGAGKCESFKLAHHQRFPFYLLQRTLCEASTSQPPSGNLSSEESDTDAAH